MHNNVQCQTKDWVPGRRHSQQRKVFVLRFIGQKISLSWFYQLCSGNDQGRWRQVGRQELWLHILGVPREIKFTTFSVGGGFGGHYLVGFPKFTFDGLEILVKIEFGPFPCHRSDSPFLPWGQGGLSRGYLHQWREVKQREGATSLYLVLLWLAWCYLFAFL